eukprot:CAMPEP_0114350166 /NCGR_PEP_ID=MMETSP0101-20121206/16130_1 /TAXON_ID=38822 ORGANISM="Pteridomonas danica, Strain PT" /NCGR_SAMPLE_ID=MMETSP0101 /ASSEMBLY_ACC=CAM_ASM_000211 /LENGTH=59 /DNA_ID=CAMNT_0001489207 /DNA_START=212 /DNA_END=391 /DNA_ORIENTATION=+
MGSVSFFKISLQSFLSLGFLVLLSTPLLRDGEVEVEVAEEDGDVMGGGGDNDDGGRMSM